MQVIINASFRTVSVLRAPFKGRVSNDDKLAILTAFESNAADVLAEAALQQSRGDIFASQRLGNAIVTTENGRTMVSRVVDETARAAHEVAAVNEAVALVKAIYGGDVVTRQGGRRVRLSDDGQLITCGTAAPFTVEQVESSVPVLFILTDNRGARLATVL